MLPDEYENYFKSLYERTVGVLLMAGCDAPQARSIAQQRVVDTAQKMVGPDVVVLDYNITDGDKTDGN